MQSSDGKFYNTDFINTKNLLRLVQSIPSPKAEPFKIWLGHEKIELTQNIYTHIDRTITKKDILKLYNNLYYQI